jgi:uncharacterized protein (DUF2126 family)/transglutaminase-like putative cysteine protease
MTIRVALNHVTDYRYDRPTAVGPQVIRLRPAPHCRTPILSYSLKVEPSEHFLNWQQDPHSNYVARYVFSKPTRRFRIEVDLVCDMTVVNPFDFFIEEYAEKYPFEYERDLARDLRPYLEQLPATPAFSQWISSAGPLPQGTTDLLVHLNQRVQDRIRYLIRLEPGVQTPDETLNKSEGSCRDSAWLLVQTLRAMGLAARFVSGYLIQLAPDIKSLDGPSGPETDFTDLHAWAEVFLPGAGWVGLDPTSGLLAGEGHIPLAATPDPMFAAPITGSIGQCEVDFEFSMAVTRIHEDPRVTKPYTDQQWATINSLGRDIDRRLDEDDVRLTMGGEPTFVSIDDMDGEEWNSAAVGPRKRQISEELIKRLRQRMAPGGLLHYGQGKWYPGESLPRWALACYWRCDGVPVWNDDSRIADVQQPSRYTLEDAKRFAVRLAQELQIAPRYVMPAYEDVAHYLIQERKLPVDVDPTDPRLSDPEERARMVQVFERGLNEPVGYVMPIQCQWWQAKPSRWASSRWPLRCNQLFLMPGDSPIGLRLPIDSLPHSAADSHQIFPVDPSSELPPLGNPRQHRSPWSTQQTYISGMPGGVPRPGITEQVLAARGSPSQNAVAGPETNPEVDPEAVSEADLPSDGSGSDGVVRTALCVELRQGRIHVFMPPLERLEDYLELVAAVELTAEGLDVSIVIEGYLPPTDSRIQCLKVTPDPGVIEVNIQPSASWEELVANAETLYEEAHYSRLGTEKFDLDGKHTGTGGGNHIVLGSHRTSDSPFLRRPDLLKSFVGYWINHPSLSYLFSGRFIGPTSQAPRIDEGRSDALYELALAFDLVPNPSAQMQGQTSPPWLIDRLFRNLLTDTTGNTHRSEFCIDKLYSPDSSSGRLGLVELRGFEMPPHARMSLTQQLLIRAMVSHFWRNPYEQPLTAWGTTLHDRFMLPYFVWSDFADVILEIQRDAIPIQLDWFRPHYEFRFPKIGEINCRGIQLELRSAIEPWYVLGEQPGGGGTVRYVDSSVERLQVLVDGITDNRFIITCNGRRVPMHPTGKQGQSVGAVRYRAWLPPNCLHPTIPVHTPLTFDILDSWAERAIGGCTYHVSHPGGRNYETFPVNALEAEARRVARFYPMGHSPGQRPLPLEEENGDFPMTLDLRRNVKIK